MGVGPGRLAGAHRRLDGGADPACLDQIEAAHRKSTGSFVRRILADAEKEFDPIARFGYGLDGDETDRDRDFAAVRGGFDDNSFVRQMRDQLEQD